MTKHYTIKAINALSIYTILLQMTYFMAIKALSSHHCQQSSNLSPHLLYQQPLPPLNATSSSSTKILLSKTPGYTRHQVSNIHLKQKSRGKFSQASCRSDSSNLSLVVLALFLHCITCYNEHVSLCSSLKSNDTTLVQEVIRDINTIVVIKNNLLLI